MSPTTLVAHIAMFMPAARVLSKVFQHVVLKLSTGAVSLIECRLIRHPAVAAMDRATGPWGKRPRERRKRPWLVVGPPRAHFSH